MQANKFKDHRLSGTQKNEIRRRLDLSAQCLGIESPQTITDNQGAPTSEFLSYANENSVSLDWLVCDDTSGLRRDLHDFIRLNDDAMPQQFEDMMDVEKRSHLLKMIDQMTDQQAAQAAVELERILGPDAT